MRCQAIGRQTRLPFLWVFLAVLVVFVAGPPVARSQDTGDDETSTSGLAGVYVDADGVLRKRVVADPSGALMRERIQAARASLSRDVAAPSRLRRISLNRLEAALHKNQAVPTDAMRYLAGLQRVRYVFYYPETKDIVLAGPAEGWVTDPTGRVVGLTSRRPTLQLQDLAVALRAFGPNAKEADVIGCSIDPTAEGLAAFQQFQRTIPPLTPGNAAQVRYIVEGNQRSMGMQNVSITGIAPDTHFAQVLVEADYRMKLIGIGLERPPVRLASYVDRASASQIAGNALQRWYFTPDYQCVRVTDDGLAAELVGDGVKLIGADEMVTAEGVRKAAASGNRASRQFVNEFTMRYAQLAARSPVFAELRNLIDLAVAAALIQREDYYEKAGWDLGVLGDEKQFKLQTYATPKKVETAVAARWKGGRLMTPIGGGVHIEPTLALDSDNLLTDDTARVEKVRQQVAPKLAEGQWWWD